MGTITVEEIDIIVQASVEQALTEFKKLVPQIKKTIKEAESAFSQLSDTNAVKDIKEQFNSIDTKKIKSEVKQAAKVIQTEYGKAFKSTEKQQELLYEKIRQKREQLANLKTNGILNEGSDEEITAKVNAKFKETGKTPELVDKTQILELEAEIEKLENKLIDFQKASKEAFNPDDTSGMTINMGSFQSASKEITGIANNIKSYKAELGTLGQAYDNLRAKMAQATSETDSNVASNTKSISEYEQKLNELYNKWGQGKVSLGEIQQFKANNSQQVSNQQVSAEPSQSSLTLWDTLKQKIEQARATIEQFKQSLGSGGNSKQLELVKYQISEIEEKLQQAKSGDIHLNTGEIIKAEAELERLNNKKRQLEQNTSSNAFSGLSSSVSKILPNMNKISTVTVKIKNQIKQWGTGMKQGLKQVLKYAAALFSLRSIYSALSSSASSWLSSQNSAAQQLSANIDYMKYAMGSAFAPIIEYVINLVYKLMKAIQSVVYALTGVNIFANASAKSYAAMADSADDASEATKQLSSVHSEINNVNSSDSNSSSSSSATPSLDLSTIDSQMASWLDSIKKELETLFEPIQNAWNNYGATMIESAKTALNSVWELIKAIGNSFKEVWLNGTGETTISLILQMLTNVFDIITAISTAWKNAWENDSNGTAIVQNLWNAFNNLLGLINNIATAIKEWWQSSSAQQFANAVVSIFKTISGWIETLTANIKKIWDGGASHVFTALMDTVSNLTQVFDSVLTAIDPVVQAILDFTGNALSGLLDAFGWVIDKVNEFVDFFQGDTSEKISGWAIVIGSLATAIGVVAGAFALWNVAIGVWNTIGVIASAVTTAFGIAVNILTSPITLVVLAIAGLIAAIVAIIVYWDEISAALSEGWEWIKTKAEEIFTAIGEFLSNIWNSIKETVLTAIENVKTAVTEKFEAIKEKVTTTIENVKTAVKDKFEEIKENISTTVENIKTSITDKFNTIKEKISTIINNVKTTLSTVWNNIKSTITTVISNIYNGIVDKFNAVKTKVSSIFSSIKTTITTIWNNIWTSIKNVINSILGGIESMANGVIKGINSVIGVLNNLSFTIPDWVPSFGGKTFGFNLSTLSEVSLPRLAKGAVLTVPTIAEMAEYPGAKTNPEIVTPVNLLKETFDESLSRYLNNNDNNQPIYLTVNVGNEKLGQILLDDLRSMKRRSGKGIEALVGN